VLLTAKTSKSISRRSQHSSGQHSKAQRSTAHSSPAQHSSATTGDQSVAQHSTAQQSTAKPSRVRTQSLITAKLDPSDQQVLPTCARPLAKAAADAPSRPFRCQSAARWMCTVLAPKVSSSMEKSRHRSVASPSYLGRRVRICWEVWTSASMWGGLRVFSGDSDL